MLAALLVCGGNATRKRDADGGERDVNGSARERGYNSTAKAIASGTISLIAEDDRLGRDIVGQHGEYDGRIRDRLLERCGDAGIAALERFCFAAIAVPERDIVAVLKQEARNGSAHLAEAEECEVCGSGHRNS
jgi:hypothetical protein